VQGFVTCLDNSKLRQEPCTEVSLWDVTDQQHPSCPQLSPPLVVYFMLMSTQWSRSQSTGIRRIRGVNTTSLDTTLEKQIHSELVSSDDLQLHILLHLFHCGVQWFHKLHWFSVCGI